VRVYSRGSEHEHIYNPSKEVLHSLRMMCHCRRVCFFWTELQTINGVLELLGGASWYARE
jgi:hypothetical protein